MAVDVFAADEQALRPVDLDRWAALVRAVIEDRGLRGDVEVSLFFVDEDTIAGLNRQFLGKDGPTDVLSFPIEEPLLLLGDVVICPTVAATNAVAHEVAEEDEVALLVVHGLLHLLGMDHEEEAEAERMEALERELLARHHRPQTSGG
jgi:probable rRNA maturation factor